ncbi:2,3-bisphosphoglycerate-independent phosphoglycerate mutase [Mesomycoplasma neurolyticum]|uniref:2,3-bisphosphoglycerate-independent phosphoglycerate mutase n=1 Tax=Mesomycoplasma neurolyticum TaxID=2120 RepID=A0A449A5P5_9BACT|nr:2,3-bisphosphoglycerate-independent phosphoglycerate mutase [Mesomycoplasma neurolyticum]VEU59558.1 phosphoglyceromutase [Mesomycoplasma neurolyticum]
MKKPVILTVIDGLGLRNEKQGNAFAQAKTPTFDEYFKNYPHSIIQASGEFVGLPEGQMGNSEVGHLNIGAGFVVYTGLSLINKALKEKTFEKNSKFIKAFKNSIKTNSTLQIMGLLSPGGVHSLEKHLFALIEAAHNFGVKKLNVHVFGDGRDVAPQSILTSIEKLENILNKYENYQIATIAGRFYAMDRDKMFDRNEIAYQTILGKSQSYFENASTYIKEQYDQKIYDEFFVPAQNKKISKNDFLKNNDSVIFFNFRPDRARQLSHMILNSDLYDYKPSEIIKTNVFVSMMKYEGLETEVAFEEMEVKTPIGKVIEQTGLKQLRLAETQKYAHVTFFMDGGNDIVFKNSERIMVNSLKVESYADAPQMSAKEITDELLAKAKNFDLVIMNFANPDMVGHTGNLNSTIKAVEILDEQLGRIKKWVEENNAVQFITADHGNAEVTEDENNNPATKHTSYPVMLITTDKSLKLKNGKLSNIAPTILDYMNIQKPDEMNEESLIIKK